MPPGTYWPDYSAGIRSPIGAWWLKSIAIDGREMLDAPLELRASTAGATVTFADTASVLGGRVVFATGEPATNCTVVVFPVERTAWFFNSRRIAAAPLDAQGRYVVRNLPAGDYLIVARADLDQLEWFNPATLEQLVRVGREAHDSQRRDGELRHHDPLSRHSVASATCGFRLQAEDRVRRSKDSTAATAFRLKPEATGFRGENATAGRTAAVAAKVACYLAAGVRT